MGGRVFESSASSALREFGHPIVVKVFGFPKGLANKKFNFN